MEEVLIVGNGGREKAIEQLMLESKEVGRVEVGVNIEEVRSQYAGTAKKPLIIIGPEAPLVDGLADDLRADDYPVFGVGEDAAQYEASKIRTTRTAARAGVRQPEFTIYEGADRHGIARDFITTHDPLDYVIKPDGLTGGKGVTLPTSQKEALDVIGRMLDGSLYDGAGKEGVLSKRYYGAELSALALIGKGKDNFVVLPLSQDHKRLKDYDNGPNTGGMGAYSPLPESIADNELQEDINQMVYDLLAQMEEDGIPYQGGVMYLGLMKNRDREGNEANNALLIEINVRLGDPEAQVVLPLLSYAGVDGYRLFRSAAEFDLEKPKVDFKNIGRSALTVCLAAEHYPSHPILGKEIHGLDKKYEGTQVFLAGAKEINDGVFVSSGGRVLYVTGLGETLDEAANRAYAAIGERGIHFHGMQYRTDIGAQALGFI